MKKSIILVILVFLFTLCGCSDNGAEKSTTKNQDNSYDTQNDISVKIYSEKGQNISEIINKYENMKASDMIFIDIPNESYLYEYISKSSTDYNFTDYYNQFVSTYNYLFPDHSINNDYLFYTGQDSVMEYDDEGTLIKGLKNAHDNYDDLVSGKLGRVNLLYDETWNMDVTEWNSPVCLELGSPIGYGFAVINKGNSAYYSGKIDDTIKGIKRYPILESYDPIDYFDIVGIYSPLSDKSYKLSDKEMSIKDAVKFFENYVNNLPYPENSTLNLTVSEVFVLKIDDGVYGYYFLTSAEFDQVPFDHIRSNISYSKFNYVFSGGNGFMLKSDDVDVIYGLRKLQVIESPINIKSVINVDEAIQIISNSLTSNVIFDVQKVEFVYSELLSPDEDGNIDYETLPRKVSPSWKFTLYNANDSLTYVCYIDAKDGNNFRYFTTPEKMELIP